MRCKFCGGEINLSVGRCISCSRPVDDTSDIRILHDLGALTEKYGLDPNAEKYAVPDEASPKEPLSQTTEATVSPRNLKAAAKPKIELQTYYELLGDNEPIAPSKEEPAPQPEPDIDALAVSEPSLERTEDAETPQAVDGAGDKISLKQRLIVLLDKADKLTEPVTERIRQWVESKMPKLNRARTSSKWERLAVAGIIAAAAILVVIIISAVIASIPASIKGEWKVSDEDAKSVFTVEFSGGEVTARVYNDDGEPNVYKKGTYTTQRQNGRDLLTIEYEDGTLAHLYYELHGKTGHFVNVDTGASDEYVLMD